VRGRRRWHDAVWAEAARRPRARAWCGGDTAQSRCSALARPVITTADVQCQVGALVCGSLGSTGLEVCPQWSAGEGGPRARTFSPWKVTTVSNGGGSFCS
jgi:hypothetical protein